MKVCVCFLLMKKTLQVQKKPAKKAKVDELDSDIESIQEEQNDDEVKRDHNLAAWFREVEHTLPKARCL